MNGDGFADVIVGAPRGNPGDTAGGEAYVVFGHAGGIPSLSLGALSPTAGFAIGGTDVGNWAGLSVSSAGDVNHDGFGDLIVGAPLANGGAGAAFVVFGHSGSVGAIDYDHLSPSQGFEILGFAAGEFAGWNVSSAGDVNGDGFSDLIIGEGDNTGTTGKAFVVLGKASGFGTVNGAGTAVVNLGSLSSSDGFAIEGTTLSDLAGLSGSSAGDINHDGFAI